MINEKRIYFFDDRRDIVIPGDASKTVETCAELFIAAARQAIDAAPTRHALCAIRLRRWA